ncbi:nitroreductase family protein [Prosthecomicrobium pneumaticum]|uniref:Putative NAD(P)H nitroreductase n=1 Tax=Prosthecomicrobium pneumaticum TaxID=81895 RepID=A0A7W9L380_9HYPH|nr:nitroreductase family protein [Prosthecomicrobium pneumaticum]MBB5754282.1 nitroreductase [Prosthecomicrobium pneumaticum]
MAHHDAPAAPLDALEPGAPELTPVPAMLAVLERRRSVPLRAFADTPIAAADLARMLAIAARVPDHGRLTPWRFIVVEGEARAAAGRLLDALYARQNPDLAEAKRDMWTVYMMRAPATVLLVSRPDAAAKVPEWDQVLSAGCAGMNLVTAAAALGYAAQWLIKWPGRDPNAAALFGVGAGERVAGFIHLGRPAARQADRPRPAIGSVVTHWRSPAD